MKVVFTVPTLPVAQPRQRHSVVQHGGRIIARNYMPGNSPVHAYKAVVKLAAAEAYQGPPLEGPLTARIEFVFPSKRKTRVPKATKPDCDNLAKSTLDALNQLLFKDDGQIYELAVSKVHASAIEQPHVVIEIESVE